MRKILTTQNLGGMRNRSNSIRSDPKYNHIVIAIFRNLEGFSPTYTPTPFNPPTEPSAQKKHPFYPQSVVTSFFLNLVQSCISQLCHDNFKTQSYSKGYHFAFILGVFTPIRKGEGGQYFRCKLKFIMKNQVH